MYVCNMICVYTFFFIISPTAEDSRPGSDAPAPIQPHSRGAGRPGGLVAPPGCRSDDCGDGAALVHVPRGVLHFLQGQQ